jgi:hypothetical protein
MDEIEYADAEPAQLPESLKEFDVARPPSTEPKIGPDDKVLDTQSIDKHLVHKLLRSKVLDSCQVQNAHLIDAQRLQTLDSLFDGGDQTRVGAGAEHLDGMRVKGENSPQET